MKSLLLTAFDPFAHYTMNPSWEVGTRLYLKLSITIIFISCACLTSLALRRACCSRKHERVQPDVILMTGMNSGTTKYRYQSCGIKHQGCASSRIIWDCKPWNEPILADAPAAYFATIPVHEIVRSLRAQKLPVQLEFASGGYVCNEIFYRAAHAYAGTTTKVGFVHVPLLPEMVFDERLARPLEETSAILKAIIERL